MTIDYKDKDEEIQAKLLSKTSVNLIEDSFNQGLDVEEVEAIHSKEEQIEKAGAIIDKANKQAENILEQAKNQAMGLKEEARSNGNKQGYEEGINRSKLEVQQIKNKLKDQERQQQEEYETLLAGITGQVSDIIASLITKLTGILVDDKMDIINYLVEKALLGNDDLDNYTIRVSEGDYDSVSLKKEHIEEIVGKDVQILVDSQLSKNQCLIETESKVIDCSLDVQLNNLINEIRMLSSI